MFYLLCGLARIDKKDTRGIYIHWGHVPDMPVRSIYEIIRSSNMLPLCIIDVYQYEQL